MSSGEGTREKISIVANNGEVDYHKKTSIRVVK